MEACEIGPATYSLKCPFAERRLRPDAVQPVELAVDVP